MFQYNTIEEAVQALRNGEIILVTDDENRENEGDMICAAEFATTENVKLHGCSGKGTYLYAYEYRTLPKTSSAANGGLQH